MLKQKTFLFNNFNDVLNVTNAFCFFFKVQIFMEFIIFKIYFTILHSACKSGNINLVKYLLSLNKIDSKSVTILFLFF